MCAALIVMLLAATCMWGFVEAVQGDGSHAVGYEDLLFDNSQVHTIDITMDDWGAFIASATTEEYTLCSITVDGEKYSNVAIRAKGNTSLSSVATLGSERYSFKVEFDHYAEGMTYHGLDKLSLNNLIQDATMMKDYLAYTLMGRMGVPSPLCSYVQVNVNGEGWGLYLAVEGVEDGFLERNGMTKGEFYKPDSMSFGGGRGNGRDFDMEKFRVEEDESETSSDAGNESSADSAAQAQQGSDSSFGGFTMPSGMGDMSQFTQGGFPASGSFGGMTPPSDGGSFSMPGGGNFQMPSGGSFQMPGSSGSDGETQSGGMPDMGGFSMPGSGNFSMPSGGNFSMPGNSGSDGETQSGGMPDMSGFQMPGGGNFQMPGSSGSDGTFSIGNMFGGFNFGMGSDDVKLVYSDDDPDSYSNIFNNAKTNVTKKDKTRLIHSLKKLNAKEDLDDTVDKSEVMTYLAVHNFLCNDDSYTGMMVHNYYLYEENGRLSIIPWDYNLAFGGFSAGSNATSTVNSPIDSPVSSGTTDSRPLIAWIFSDEEALSAYHSEYDRFLTENVENGWLASEIDRVKEMITPYLEKDASAFYDMDEFEKAVRTLETFCDKRGQSVRGQLEGTIPSTSNGQRSSSALIDASGISTGDMGSMSSGGGFGNGAANMPSSRPGSRSQESSSDGDSGASEDGSGMPSGFSGQGSQGSGAFSGFGSGQFGGFDGSSQPGGSQTPPSMPGNMPSGDSSGGFSMLSGFQGTATQEVSTADGAPPAEAPAEDGQGEDLPESAGKEDAGTKNGSGTRKASMPGGFSGSFSGSFGGQRSSSSNWIMLAVCAGALLLALALVWKVRNHND